MKTANAKENIKVIIGASLLQCALLGILVNTTGTLFSPIVQEYGFAMTRVSAFNIIKSVAGALTGAAAASVMYRMDPRKYLLGVIGMISFGFAMLVFGANTFLWYISPALVSLSSTVGIVAIPTFLGQRLSKGAGSATGFAMAFSGVGGVAFNPIAAFLIQLVGWRWTVLILCAITMTFALVGVLLLFDGTASFGEAGKGKPRETKSEGDVPSHLGKRFILCTLSLFCGSFCTAFVPFVNIYAERLGYSIVTGALLASMVMVGKIVGKLIFGMLCDLAGTWKAMMVSAGCVFLGLVGFLLFWRILPLLMASGFLFGMSYSIATIAVSRCTNSMYGPAQVRRFNGIHTSITCGVAAVSSLGIGALYDWWGSFSPMLLILAGAVLISFLCSLLSLRETAKNA